jgi:hypothetical protein
MENQPPQVPPRRRPKALAFLFGIAGLLLLNGAADSLVRHRPGPAGWLLLISGVGFLVLALWWAAARAPGSR